MRSITSCWEYLRNAIGNHVIVSLGGGAYDILSLVPGGRGEIFLETGSTRVVGVYSPGADLAAIMEDADALDSANRTTVK